MKKSFLFIYKIVPLLPFLSVTTAILNAGKPFLVLYFSASVIEQLYSKAERNEIIKFILLFFAFLWIFDLLSAFLARKKEVCFVKLIHAEQELLAEKCLSMDYEQLEHSDVQSALENIRQSRFQMGDMFEKQIHIWERLLNGTITTLISGGYAIRLLLVVGKGSSSGLLSPWVGAIVLLFLFIASFYSAKNSIQYSKNVFGRFKEVAPINRIFGFYRKNVFQNYHYGKDIRIFAEQELIDREFGKTLGVIQNFMENVGKQEGRFRVVNSFFHTLLNGVVYFLVGLYAYYGKISVGSIVQYSGAVGRLLTGITDLVKAAADWNGTKKFTEQYFELLEMKSEQKKDGRIPDKELTEIEFKQVSYRYPNAKEDAIKDISFKISKGQRLAIVGKNGSGKTTCIRLLCRLYRPTEGSITLNGIDIWEYDYAEYLTLISVVFQDFKLFAFTLGQNIAAGDTKDAEKLNDALKKAGLWNRVCAMERGTETYLYQEFEENGVELSGGEAQKAAVAKALYKNAQVFILDEPTASLDPLAESQIYSDFNRFLKEKTVIYISHRLSSCLFCDRILVLESGNLIEIGNHRELLALHGKYEELWNAQVQYYKTNIEWES